MLLRRPRFLFLQRRDRPAFSLENLLAGGAGVVKQGEWLALAPHLETELDLEFADLAVFDAVDSAKGTERYELVTRFGDERIERLLAAGLLIGDHEAHAQMRQREQALHDSAWWAVAALAQRFGRWRDVDVMIDEARSGERTWSGMIAEHGPPPVEADSIGPAANRIALPPPCRSALDELLAARSTCRNFDTATRLPLPEVATLLHRVFAAQARQDFTPGVVALKKNSPSGGGLHPIEAYLLVQRVEGLMPGLYHYQSVAHVLEPMRPLDGEMATALAQELVAGQHWFANAPVLVLMAARFQRNFWKYRNNSKAWKVIQLDAGHLSQNLYLSATEQGYGAFVTGAINDECAERLFGLDGLSTGAVVVCGFGRRAETIVTTEFDPLGKAVR